jgi:hypothetical protein
MELTLGSWNGTIGNLAQMKKAPQRIDAMSIQLGLQSFLD